MRIEIEMLRFEKERGLFLYAMRTASFYSFGVAKNINRK
jgi:hypothetical protein